MTQVIQHNYGKSKVTLLEIRSAIKAVRDSKSGKSTPCVSERPKAAGISRSNRSRKGA